MNDLFSYHNTAGEDKNLPVYESKAYTEEQKVLKLFLLKNLTALEVAELLNLHESSARRAVTNLATRGLLIKTEEKRIGKYGRANHIFKIK